MAIQELINVLQRLVELHEQLSVLATAKKQLIIENRVDDISKIMVQEARMMRLVEQEDVRRQEAITRFLFEQGIQARGKITVTELSKLVYDKSLKAQLLDVTTRLSKKVEVLKEKNALNQLLVQQSLQFISFNLDVMLGSPVEEVTYSKPKPSPYELQRKAVFDRRT